MKAGRILLACVAWIAAGSLCAAEAELALAEGAACRQARLLADTRYGPGSKPRSARRFQAT